MPYPYLAKLVHNLVNSLTKNSIGLSLSGRFDIKRQCQRYSKSSVCDETKQKY